MIPDNIRTNALFIVDMRGTSITPEVIENVKREIPKRGMEVGTLKVVEYPPDAVVVTSGEKYALIENGATQAPKSEETTK